MSFVDELREEEVDGLTSDKVKDIVDDMVETIKRECKSQARKGNQKISGYIQFIDPNDPFRDEEERKNKFVEQLPKVAEHKIKPTIWNGLKEFSIFKHAITKQWYWEMAIYFNYNEWYTVSIDNRGFAEQVRDKLAVELDKLGFKDFNLTIQRLKDVVKVVKTGMNILNGITSESTEKQVKSDRSLYVIKIEINWQHDETKK
jgi:hypothetical protein